MEADYTTKSPEETVELGKKLASRLQLGDTVLLYGDLGMGKTHFTKGIAVGLGIKEVIKSPTYAYVNRYSIGRSQVYHYDLYRLQKGDDITSIGLEETMEDAQAINVVEWADRLGDSLPSKYISVYFEGEGDERKISIEFVSPTIVPEESIVDFYEEWIMPMHIREHCKGVTKVATQLGEAYIKKGEIINLNLLYPAGMLHDLHRVCDIRELDKSNFSEEVTDKQWTKWTRWRKEYQDMHHADITAQILSQKGFTDTAELIRLHMSKNIILEPESYNTLEKKIMYYADKRVKHDQVVDLEERFRDGYERYGQYDTKDGQEFFEKVKKATFKLEEELFKGLSIQPDTIT